MNRTFTLSLIAATITGGAAAIALQPDPITPPAPNPVDEWRSAADLALAAHEIEHCHDYWNAGYAGSCVVEYVHPMNRTDGEPAAYATATGWNGTAAVTSPQRHAAINATQEATATAAYGALRDQDRVQAAIMARHLETRQMGAMVGIVVGVLTLQAATVLTLLRRADEEVTFEVIEVIR